MEEKLANDIETPQAEALIESVQNRSITELVDLLRAKRIIYRTHLDSVSDKTHALFELLYDLFGEEADPDDFTNKQTGFDAGELRTVLVKFRVTHFEDVRDPDRVRMIVALMNFCLFDKPVRIQQSNIPGAGYGLFATAPITQRKIVADYGGRWNSMPRKESVKSDQYAPRLQSNYVITAMSNAQQLNGWLLDGERFFTLGEAGRFINAAVPQKKPATKKVLYVFLNKQKGDIVDVVEGDHEEENTGLWQGNRAPNAVYELARAGMQALYDLRLTGKDEFGMSRFANQKPKLFGRIRNPNNLDFVVYTYTKYPALDKILTDALRMVVNPLRRIEAGEEILIDYGFRYTMDAAQRALDNTTISNGTARATQTVFPGEPLTLQLGTQWFSPVEVFRGHLIVNWLPYINPRRVAQNQLPRMQGLLRGLGVREYGQKVRQNNQKSYWELQEHILNFRVEYRPDVLNDKTLRYIVALVNFANPWVRVERDPDTGHFGLFANQNDIRRRTITFGGQWFQFHTMQDTKQPENHRIVPGVFLYDSDRANKFVPPPRGQRQRRKQRARPMPPYALATWHFDYQVMFYIRDVGRWMRPVARNGIVTMSLSEGPEAETILLQDTMVAGTYPGRLQRDQELTLRMSQHPYFDQLNGRNLVTNNARIDVDTNQLRATTIVQPGQRIKTRPLPLLPEERPGQKRTTMADRVIDTPVL